MVLLRTTCTQLPVPTCAAQTVHNSGFRGSVALFWPPCAPDTHAGNSSTYNQSHKLKYTKFEVLIATCLYVPGPNKSGQWDNHCLSLVLRSSEIAGEDTPAPLVPVTSSAQGRQYSLTSSAQEGQYSLSSCFPCRLMASGENG